jgi:hypothetical protein
MLFDALIDVFGKANIIALAMRYGANDANVEHAVRRTITDSLYLLQLCIYLLNIRNWFLG